MNPEQLWETTMNPDTRRLLPVGYGDQSPEDTTRMFDMLMGKGNPRNAAPGSKKGQPGGARHLMTQAAPASAVMEVDLKADDYADFVAYMYKRPEMRGRLRSHCASPC